MWDLGDLLAEMEYRMHISVSPGNSSRRVFVSHKRQQKIRIDWCDLSPMEIADEGQMFSV